MPIEFYWNDNCSAQLAEDMVSGLARRIEDIPSDIIQRIDMAVSHQKPGIYNALITKFGNGPQNAFDRVYQFCACNFSTHDGHVDVDEDYNLTTERVPCPIRHRCNHEFCVDASVLSVRENDIVRLFARGYSESAIADKLFIAPATAHNHINNIYHKLGFTGNPHPDRMLLKYAYDNKII